MHLAETSLIKKYENNIGDSIENVGGDLLFRDHWLPFLDDIIERELTNEHIDPSYIIGIVDQELDNRGVTQEAINSWNWALIEISRLKQRVKNLEDLTLESCIWEE